MIMYCDTVRCKRCGWPVNRRVHVDPDGVPRWTCPICGAVWDGFDFYKTVSREEAAEIIEFRYPEGYFMVKEDGKRSEERRVGKEGRSRWLREAERKKGSGRVRGGVTDRRR